LLDDNVRLKGYKLIQYNQWKENLIT
jgi:hypothetical protein